MHFFSTQEQLSRALAMTSRIISPQNNLAVAAGIQFDALANHVRLTATDLFTVITTEIPADVDRQGTSVLPAALINDLMHRVPTAMVEVDADESSKTTIRYGKNRTTIHGYGHERLPEFPNMEGERHTVMVPAAALSSLSRQLLYACAKDETRPVLRGVYVRLQSGRMIFAATDGSRLSHTWIPIPFERDTAFEAILPAKFLAEAARLAGNLQPTTFELTNQLVKVTTDESEITSRVLDGQYPDYSRVIPKEYVISGRIRIAELRSAIERVNIIASKERAASIRVAHRSDHLELSATSQEYGNTFEYVDWNGQGPEMELLFNPHYLLEALRSFDGDEIVLEFSGVQSPARMRELLDTSNFSHIVLPLRQLV